MDVSTVTRSVPAKIPVSLLRERCSRRFQGVHLLSIHTGDDVSNLAARGALFAAVPAPVGFAASSNRLASVGGLSGALGSRGQPSERLR
jgi:hypothetical protein